MGGSRLISRTILIQRLENGHISQAWSARFYTNFCAFPAISEDTNITFSLLSGLGFKACRIYSRVCSEGLLHLGETSVTLCGAGAKHSIRVRAVSGLKDVDMALRAATGAFS